MDALTAKLSRMSKPQIILTAAGAAFFRVFKRDDDRVTVADRNGLVSFVVLLTAFTVIQIINMWNTFETQIQFRPRKEMLLQDAISTAPGRGPF